MLNYGQVVTSLDLHMSVINTEEYLQDLHKKLAFAINYERSCFNSRVVSENGPRVLFTREPISLSVIEQYTTLKEALKKHEILLPEVG